MSWGARTGATLGRRGAEKERKAAKPLHWRSLAQRRRSGRGCESTSLTHSRCCVWGIQNAKQATGKRLPVACCLYRLIQLFLVAGEKMARLICFCPSGQGGVCGQRGLLCASYLIGNHQGGRVCWMMASGADCLGRWLEIWPLNGRFTVKRICFSVSMFSKPLCGFDGFR